jgi:hypothetical protein
MHWGAVKRVVSSLKPLIAMQLVPQRCEEKCENESHRKGHNDENRGYRKLNGWIT